MDTGAVSSLSRSATFCALHVAEIGVIVFGFFFLLGWISEETNKTSPWKTAFVIMAIVGVAGEWVADLGVFALSEHLQTISDKEVAKLRIDEADARRDIAQAND